MEDEKALKNTELFGEWLERWLALYVKPTVKLQTYEKYKGLIKNHIEPKLGNFNLQDLTADVLQGFVVELCVFLSSNSVNGIISVINI